jgi:hypothetical protein
MGSINFTHAAGPDWGDDLIDVDSSTGGEHRDGWHRAAATVTPAAHVTRRQFTPVRPVRQRSNARYPPVERPVAGSLPGLTKE